MPEEIQWMVVRQDTHGNRDLHARGLTEVQADAKLAHFAEVNHRKPHKQEYYKFS